MGDIGTAALLSAMLALAIGPRLIPFLQRLKFGQVIRQEGPQRHQAKAGTPTMGGVIFLFPLLVAVPLLLGWTTESLLLLFVTVGHGVLGFIDDYIKVVLKRNLGLRAGQKLAGQLLIAAVIAWVAADVLGRGTIVWIPGWNSAIDLGWGYHVLIFFVLVGTTNAVNLTDGLDGLAAGTTCSAFIGYGVIAWWLGMNGVAVFCAALVGAVSGFLRFNLHPARVFMGDTGSLALGGALAALAILTRTELLLVLLGGLFVAEALSVMLQVASFKTTGKRIFRMSPLHHHFELGGWSETKVVRTFWLVEFCCAAAAVAVTVLQK